MERIKKIPYIQYIPVIIIAIILYKLIDNLSVVQADFSILAMVISPFIWGFGIAFIVNSLLKVFESRFKMNRKLAILCCYLLLIGALVLLGTLIIPIIALNINDIIVNTPTYIKKVQSLILQYAGDYEAFTKVDYKRYLDVGNLSKMGQDLGNYFDVFSKVIMGIITVTEGFIKFVIGMIISIYILHDKEKFIHSVRRVLYAVLSKKYADKAVEFTKEANVIYSTYLIGQATDSCIMACIAFFGFSLLGAPYAVLLAMIYGLCNMIPFFGPLIAAVPIVVICFMSSPATALYVLILILALREVDIYIMSPKVVGGSLGVTPFWSILAILIGGYFFGIMGMILCVPTFALIRNVFIRKIDKRLKMKNLTI